MHIETAIERNDITYSINQFLEYVKELLPSDKFLMFVALFRFPIKTVDLTEQIFNYLEKVFDGRDSLYSYEFINDEAKEDFKTYKKEVLGGNVAWFERSWEVMKMAINSILIVDMPRIEDQSTNTGLPSPYYRFKRIESIHDYDTVNACDLEYLIYFTKDDKELVVLDDEAYRVFALDEGKQITEEIVNAPHGLGYCPARFFWSESLSMKDKDIKKSPLSNQLTNLDDLLFSMINKKHLDLYAAYPIHWMTSIECDFESGTPGGASDDGFYQRCSNGFLKDDQDKYIIDRTGSVARCPVCSNNRFAGAGSLLEVPLLDPQHDGQIQGDPIGMLQVDKASLEYNESNVAKQASHIFTNVVGFGGDVVNDHAVNELQVLASFESRTSVLINLKKNFEKAQKWVEDTICRLRYQGQFKSASLNYGTSFYLMTIEELLSLYEKCKKLGASDTYLDSLQEQIIETQHRSNPTQEQRAKILLHLEPYRHLTKSELVNFAKIYQGVDPADIGLKLNFSNFIARFEREQLPIQQFGEQLPFNQRIKKVTEILKAYVNESNTQERDDDEQDD